MSKRIFYFYNEDDENCMSMEAIKEQMAEDGLTEKTVCEADIDTDNSYFWCTENGAAGVKGEDTCGKDCEVYKPRNGKNGCCKHLRRCRIPGRDVVVKIKPTNHE